MLKRVSIALVILLVASLSTASAQDEDTKKMLEDIAKEVHAVEPMILAAQIEKAIEELNFAIGRLRNVTTNMLSSVLKELTWPTNWMLDGEPSTTSVGAGMISGTGFDLRLKNKKTGDVVSFNFIKSPLGAFSGLATSLPFGQGGRNLKRIGSYKGTYENGKLTATIDDNIATWELQQGEGNAEQITVEIGEHYVKNSHAKVKAALEGGE